MDSWRGKGVDNGFKEVPVVEYNRTSRKRRIVGRHGGGVSFMSHFDRLHRLK